MPLLKKAQHACVCVTWQFMATKTISTLCVWMYIMWGFNHDCVSNSCVPTMHSTRIPLIIYLYVFWQPERFSHLCRPDAIAL